LIAAGGRFQVRGPGGSGHLQAAERACSHPVPDRLACRCAAGSGSWPIIQPWRASFCEDE
jgi:hypothetical protein